MSDSTELTYGLDDFPGMTRVLLYGFQWALIFLPTLAILSAICSEHLGLQGSARVLFFQRVLLTTGAVMILQTLLGHCYPLLDGPSSALLLSFVVLVPQGLPVIQGGMMVGGAFVFLLCALRWLRHVHSLITDNVIGVILLLIALTILPYLVPMIIGQTPLRPQGDPGTFGISMLVLVMISLCSHWLSGFLRTISLFLGILLGTILMGASGRLDPGGIGEAPWLSLPVPFVPGPLEFSLSAITVFLVAYLAVIINGVGSIYSIGEVVGKQGMRERLNRGIGLTGLGGILSGTLGVIGTVSYGYSPGVILVTRVGSRFTVTACGCIILALAFFQKGLAVLAAIPAAVVGAAMVAGMAAQVGASISILTRSGRALGSRDYLVIGIPILLGALVAILPEPFFLSLPALCHALVKNGLVVGIVVVLLLEHVLLRERKQRKGAPVE